jgi:hypothetical protein
LKVRGRRGWKETGSSIPKIITPCLGIGCKMRLSCMMHLHKSPYLSLEALIISCFPYVPEKKENLGQGLVCGIER